MGSFHRAQGDGPRADVPDTDIAGNGLASTLVMRLVVLLTCLTLTAATASAQTSANPWSRGTTLAVFGGTATTSPRTTGIFGAAAGWELTPRAEIEGVAAWLAQREGSEAFAADLKLLVSLTPPARIVPYLGGGVGLFRSSFETAGTLHDFYQRRVGDRPRVGGISFTDPTVVVAAGAHLFISRHFSIRPELGMRIVTDRPQTYRVTTVTFGLTYHVEEHEIGASR